VVDTLPLRNSPNGDEPTATERALPDVVTLSKADLQQFPSPGTQRALKAELGKDFLQLVGPNADSADRTQTQIWMHLRKSIRDLRWDECDEIGLHFADGDDAAMDPTLLAASALSPPSADSGE
jgi:hypothetical protein